MVLLFEITDLAAIETFLVSIPESLSLLIFGMVLVAAAVILRKLLGRRQAEKFDDEPRKEAYAKVTR